MKYNNIGLSVFGTLRTDMRKKANRCKKKLFDANRFLRILFLALCSIGICNGALAIQSTPLEMYVDNIVVGSEKLLEPLPMGGASNCVFFVVLTGPAHASTPISVDVTLIGDTPDKTVTLTVGNGSDKTTYKVSGTLYKIVVASVTGDVSGCNLKAVRLSDVVYPRINNSTTISVDNTVSKKGVLPVQWTSIQEAEGYQLEWLYLNDYNSDGTTGKNVTPDFSKGATRIETTNLKYEIPANYESGKLFVRVRAYTYSDPTKKQVVVGGWTYMDPQKVDAHNEKMNWQSIINYSEEGKNKEVLTYYDGTMRPHQVLTRNSTNGDILVGETYYDNEGRATVQALPVPSLIDNDHISYHENFNQYKNSNNADVPYDRNAFDKGNDCGISAEPMLNISGSSRYYSTENPKKTEGYNAYIPDAEGYPFSQTEYTPDNTGRIRRQGGVGLQYQLGEEGVTHPTTYYYGKPTPEDLMRMFGSQCGDSSHYQKT